ncbi:excitatory amino acid transporter 3-like [Ptychodera flava]|uniref:excitatory amino acid transporter 3-like n=1 Tax=Ptychodera flava TaxID=63121 RepID=UPI00396AA8A1
MDKGGVSKGRRNSNNEDEENLCSGKCCCKWMKDNVLLVMIATGIILGLLIGFLLKLHSDIEFTAKEIAYISFPGVIFLNMLKMIIIPLIFTSVTAGLAVLDTKSSEPVRRKKVEADDAFMDLIRNMVPPNLIAACFETYRTSLVPVAPEPMPSPEPSNMTTLLTTGMMMSTDNATTLPMTPTVVYKSQGGYVDGSNILGIITFSIVLGVVISKMGPKGAILIHFFVALNDAIMRIVWLVMWFAPFGIMFLIMGRVLLMDDWSVIGGQLGMYMVTVITGLLIHGLIILPLLYVIFTRKNPIRFFLGVLPAILTAFGTASSSATLPVTIRCVEENLRVDKRVAQFVLPIGATINMDGTALYEAVAAIFIAQLNNYDLDIGQYITISITATMASIGAAGIPEAGLVTTVLVLTAVGLPVEDVALLLVIDWLIDRIRTAVNVFGDSTGAGIIEKYTTHDLEEDSKEEEFDAIEAGYYDNKAKHNYGYKNSDNFDTPL